MRLWPTIGLASLACKASVVIPNNTPSPRDDAAASSCDCRLPADDDVYLSSGFGFIAGSIPSTGTVTAFMLFVDFPDQQANDSTHSLYDVFQPDAPRWYRTSSFGQLNLSIQADTSRFVRMPHSAASYDWQRGVTFDQQQSYIQDALEAYNQTISPVDVLYIVPTRAATNITYSPTFIGEVTTRAGQKVAKRSITFGHDTFTTWQYKVLNHETGHCMGLPDMYPFASGLPTGEYTGGWDIMADINAPSPDYIAWDKWRLGWLADSQVDCVVNSSSSTHQLSPIDCSSSSCSTKAVVVKYNDTMALVAEVRSTEGNDEATCATGVLLYTVSTIIATGYGPVQVIDTNLNSGGCDGAEKNDAPLSLDRGKASSYTSATLGVTISVTGQNGNNYQIEVVKN